ncbi:MAG TPA: ABC transporter permease [Candidatus Coproplasma excrementipullorum]|nr:ABC transporter permease [Candidatus Coproplasma excrementipullorum]
MKTYLKTLGRMFSKHVTRFISIIFIVLLAVGFSSGVGAATDKINHSLDEYYRSANVTDFIIKSSAEGGFSDEDIQTITDMFTPEDGEEEEAAQPTIASGMSVDVELEIGGQTSLTRIYFLDNFPEFTVNIPDVIEQTEYDGTNQIAYAQQANKSISGVDLGSTITLDFVDILDQLSIQDSGEPLDDSTKDLLSMVFDEEQLNVPLTITQELQSPLLIALDGDPSYVNGEDVELPETGSGLGDLVTVDNVIYTSSDILPSTTFFGTTVEPIARGDIYVSIADRDLFNCFSGSYEDYVNEMTAEIESAFVDEDGNSAVQVITLYDNFSLYSLNSYSQKVEALGWVLVVAFLLVTALVVYSNISRLVEEERAQIACMRTLGYSAFKIIFKYALFAAVAAGIGGFGAYFVGEGLAQLIYYIFNFSYVMPQMSLYFSVTFFMIVFFIIAVVILAATIISGIKMTSAQPAVLLRPKPPKAGKKVIFERFPKFWNLLSFKYKSTVRNVLRYKSRFLMTVVAVAISMALVMAGLAILDLCLFGSLKSTAIIAISIVIIVFAGLLTATVIYTLTNINISERNRELATLMVLGYQDSEVSGYIYREIYIDTLIGIMFGYPLAALLIWIVFNMIGLGTLGGVSWFMWLIAPVVVALFTWIVTIMLRRKIVRIDMNESLKAIE